MVKEGASKRLDGLVVEKRDSLCQRELLKYIESNFKGFSY